MKCNALRYLAVLNFLGIGFLSSAQKIELAGVAGYGAYNYGVIFKYSVSDSAYTDILDFQFPSLGCIPRPGLLQSGNGYFYGVNQGYGLNNDGTLFDFNPNLPVQSSVFDFAQSTSGAWPQGPLIQDSNGILYGVTQVGGTGPGYGSGIIFRYNPNASQFTNIYDFGDTTSEPIAPLALSKRKILYGTTTDLGEFDFGVIYGYDLAHSRYSVLYNFNNSDFFGPTGGLTLVGDSILYGVAGFGGLYGSIFGGGGVLFSYNLNSDTLSVLFNFGGLAPDSSLLGATPEGGLIQGANGLLYGTTGGGGKHNFGALFSYNPATGNEVDLHDFDSISGKWPQGNLIQASDGKLYGTTPRGGAHGYGVLFSYDINSQIFSKLYDFADTLTGAGPPGYLAELSDIFTGSLPISVCAGDTVDIPFIAGGVHQPGNIFIVQLSDSSGNFINSVNIGSLAGTTSGVIKAAIPSGMMPGSGYLIRVTGNLPVVTGGTNGAGLTIYPIPSVTLSSHSPVCMSDTLKLFANVSGGSGVYPDYNWSTPDSINIGNSPNPLRFPAELFMAGNYSVSVTDSKGCKSSSSVLVEIDAPIDSVSVTGAVSPTGNGTITIYSAGTPPYTYVWSDGEQTASIQAPPGVYFVTVTDSLGCISSDTITIGISGIMAVNNDRLAIIYPNPVENILFVELTSSAQAEIKIIDIAGATIATVTARGNITPLNIAGLAAGPYLISVRDKATGQVKFLRFDKI